MEKVMYRELAKSDYEQIKKLICDAFGFSDFLKDEKLLDLVLTIYLEGCILDSTYSRVAVKNDKVIGIILGKSDQDKNKIRKFHNSLNFLTTGAKLMLSSRKNKHSLKEFSKIKDTYKEIIAGKEKDFQGCIQLFIVSQESRGLGVGKTLVSQLFNYMKNTNVNSLYLYTDTRCNYGFYDSQNFKRINEKNIYFESFKTNLSVFLYGYKF
ncbi:GNAT family N-acetyltransferase [Romboutsia lituseburensis]|uniref:GNAT family N-acetyltransferase n=1 Tax=Romboutsia lituseburensis TaxID=1537 RepID=UPI00215ACC66|nr:GNAT family N-acetyltransferase [Romboutsia lituseburensis]MCR8745856.1 GNAT family N-acetyltransferase [Romboutsia lituseburensis]